MTKNFKPEFRQEVSELVVDKGYSIRGAAEAMSVGNLQSINGCAISVESVTEKKPKVLPSQNKGVKYQP
jgi:transposase-like protein